MTAAQKILSPFLARVAIVLVAIVVACGTVPPAAAQSTPKAVQFNIDGKGLLLRGYDPVAYFKTGAPVKGDPQWTVTHKGATLYFASDANRDAFAAAPDKYLPAYGGFCAYGVASGYKVDGDPAVWKIVDGKLYLNIKKSVGQTFSADPARYIQQAERKWPQMRDKTPTEVNK
jgi:YHS domain-containing protein